MKVVFPFIGQQNLGIESLSAMLKYHGHESYLAFDPGLFDDKFYFAMPQLGKQFSVKERLIQDIIDLKPDLLAFCVFSDALHWALDMAEAIKSQIEVPTVFGGPHATEAPEHTLKHSVVDYICKAEGEYALLELADCLEAGKPTNRIQNIWCKDEHGNFIQNPVRPITDADLDNLPLPDKTLFEPFMSYSSLYGTMSARGCPYQCTFCSAPVLKDAYKEVGSKSIRFGGIDRVIDELKEMKQKHRLKHIRFYDDVFTAKTERVLDFSERYKKEIGIPFIISTHPQMINETIVKALKEAGCKSVELGIQSMSEEIRKTILKRPETDRAIQRTIDLCKKYDLSFCLDHIFGFPTEPESSQQNAFDNYLKWRPWRVQTFWLALHPGTEMVQILKNMGQLSDQEIEDLFNGHVHNYHDYGVVKNKAEQVMFQNYEILFKLVPLLPESWTKWFYTSNWYQQFYRLPKSVCWTLDIINALRFAAPEHRAYGMYYLKNLWRFFRKGSFLQKSTYAHRASSQTLQNQASA